MKKTIALLLAVLFVIALFAGCGGNTSGGNVSGGNTSGGNVSGGNTSGGSTSGGSTSDDTAGGEVEDSPYNLAKGNWELNEDGYASEKYEYTKPLSTTDEVFTRWTTCYTPQYIPEGGWASISTWAGVEEYTGVHIEYDVLASDTREQNFSVLTASDDCHDIMDQANFFWRGTQVEAFDPEDGYWANIIDYKEYMPNYLYELWSRSFVGGEFSPMGDAVQYAYNDEENIMPGFYGMLKDPAPGMGVWYRQDILTELGYGAAVDEIKTIDDMEAFFEAVKVNYPGSFGACTYSTIEIQCMFFSGYNTVAYTDGFSYVRVEDGVIKFNGTEEVDRTVVGIVRDWVANGYMHPNWQSFEQNQYIEPYWANSEIMSAVFTPSEVGNYQNTCLDPDCDWQTVTYPRLYDDQILEYGHAVGSGFHWGSCWISRNCENLELMVSYWDWWFSEFGADWTSWGAEGPDATTEGYMWYYNEDGERQLTEWCLNHEAGMAWLMCLYGANGLVETCLQHHMRNYAYPEGKVTAQAFDIWIEDNYGGSYDLPSGISFLTEETDEMNEIYSDLQTYFQENYIMFITGDKDMSEWDAFQSGLLDFGFGRYKELYQGAYDRHMGVA